MYLLRLPNSVYYTRIATPISLQSSGSPKEFKFSLLTRERKVAYLRNIEQVQLLHTLFDRAKVTALIFSEFKAELAHSINQLRQNSQSMKNGYHCALLASNGHADFSPINRSEELTRPFNIVGIMNTKDLK
ncbi:DUF6538 domain-containing protein [Vibrio sp. 10N.247.310.81]|uniref:DUF6538 domain-containing protein n=1 Tax=Vibrio sp. 10N.247.310.81 TaxID=3229981 RepID=UPI00354D98D7